MPSLALLEWQFLRKMIFLGPHRKRFLRCLREWCLKENLRRS